MKAMKAVPPLKAMKPMKVMNAVFVLFFFVFFLARWGIYTQYHALWVTPLNGGGSTHTPCRHAISADAVYHRRSLSSPVSFL